MPTLLCTAKYRKTFGLPEYLLTTELDEGALGPWYADTLNVGSRRAARRAVAMGLIYFQVSSAQRRSGRLRSS